MGRNVLCTAISNQSIASDMGYDDELRQNKWTEDLSSVVEESIKDARKRELPEWLHPGPSLIAVSKSKSDI